MLATVSAATKIIMHYQPEPVRQASLVLDFFHLWCSAMSGIQALLDAVHFDEQLRCQLVITGEGRMDSKRRMEKRR